jgi:hypothetical protein
LGEEEMRRGEKVPRRSANVKKGIWTGIQGKVKLKQREKLTIGKEEKGEEEGVAPLLF